MSALTVTLGADITALKRSMTGETNRILRDMSELMKPGTGKFVSAFG